MKILFLTLLLATGTLSNSEAQINTSAQKTQQEWIAANKAQFIGKPFSALYNVLTIKPKSIWGGISHANRFVEYNHSFYYVDSTSYDDSAYFFIIEWKEPILQTETQKYSNDFYRAFTTRDYPIYADKVIKSLEAYPPKKILP